MKRIVQKRSTSCGVACVAMLARISYRDADRARIATLDDSTRPASHRTKIPEIRAILAELGWNLGRRVSCNDFSKVPPHSLAAVQLKELKGKEPTWHWVVCESDDEGPFILDPRASIGTDRRRNLSRVRLAWYHRVTRS